MKSTRFDYINLVLFVILLAIITTLYTIAYLTTESNGTPVLAAILISFLALFPCNSITNIWFNNAYDKAISKGSMRFYGRDNYLQEYKTDAGEQLRGTFFFLSTFLVPSLIAKDWFLVILFFVISMLFFSGVTTYVERFKKYLNSHLTTTIQ